jgi:hypothetical protein
MGVHDVTEIDESIDEEPIALVLRNHKVGEADIVVH